MRQRLLAILAAGMLGACSAPTAVQMTPVAPPAALPRTPVPTALAPTVAPPAAPPIATLAPTPQYPGDPGWPKGWLAITAQRSSGTTDIELMPVDGGATAYVTRSHANDWAAAWSPDASQIAFLSDRDGGPSVYLTNTQGSTLKRLVLSSREEPISSVAWSPDGTRLVYDHNCALETVSVAGGDTRTLFVPADGQDACFTAPSYAPDGARIVFAATVDSNRSAIFTIDAAGGTPTQLTDYIGAPGSEQDPVFSPDGTQLAFVSQRSGTPFIYLAATDGRNPQRLTTRTGAESLPTWSPDGVWIAFTSLVGQRQTTFAIALSSRALVALDGLGSETDPAWAPREIP